MAVQMNGLDNITADMRPKNSSVNIEKDLKSEFSAAVQEIYDKVKNGDTEESIPIGGQSFTIKEWDRLMKRFDKVQEGIRESIEEEIEKRKAEEEDRAVRQKVELSKEKDEDSETEELLQELL